MSDLPDGSTDQSQVEQEQPVDAAARMAATMFDGGAVLEENVPSQEDLRRELLEDSIWSKPSPDQPESPDEAADSPDEAADSPDRVTSEYSREGAAREDLRVLVAALDKVSRQLEELTDTLQQRLSGLVTSPPDLKEEIDTAEQLISDASQLKGQVTALPELGVDQDPGPALSATAKMAATVGDAEAATKQFPDTPVWKKIWETLQKAASRLWSLISNLVKVKEWSVTGQVGTGVLGLAQASISVTFGQ